MKVNQAVNTGPFVYCNLYQAPHQKITYQNSGDGHYHQWLYIVEGEATGEVRETEDINTTPLYIGGPDEVGTLVDLHASKDKWVTTVTEEKGLAIVLFNPIPTTSELDIEIVQGPATRSVTATDKRITAVCISGPITANGNTLISQQYAKILPGNTVELILPEHTTVALVK